jgi:hypothetical protein
VKLAVRKAEKMMSGSSASAHMTKRSIDWTIIEMRNYKRSIKGMKETTPIPAMSGSDWKNAWQVMFDESISMERRPRDRDV